MEKGAGGNEEENLLLEGVEEDPGGVLEEQGGVGQQQRLLVGPREGEGGALGRLGVCPHICKKRFVKLGIGWAGLTPSEEVVLGLPAHGQALRALLQGLYQDRLGHLQGYPQGCSYLPFLASARLNSSDQLLVEENQAK